MDCLCVGRNIRKEAAPPGGKYGVGGISEKIEEEERYPFESLYSIFTGPPAFLQAELLPLLPAFRKMQNWCSQGSWCVLLLSSSSVS